MSCWSTPCSRVGSRAPSSSRQIHAAKLNVPVIVLTVPQNPVEVDPANGIHGVLAMPFSGFDLMNRITGRPQGIRRDLVDGGDPDLLDLRPEGRRRQDDDRVQPCRRDGPGRAEDRAHRRQRPVRRPALAAEGPPRRPVDPGPADRPDRRIGPVRRALARPVGDRHPPCAAAHRDGRDDHGARPRQDPVAAAPGLHLDRDRHVERRSTTSTSRSSTPPTRSSRSSPTTRPRSTTRSRWPTRSARSATRRRRCATS